MGTVEVIVILFTALVGFLLGRLNSILDDVRKNRVELKELYFDLKEASKHEVKLQPKTIGDLMKEITDITNAVKRVFVVLQIIEIYCKVPEEVMDRFGILGKETNEFFNVNLNIPQATQLTTIDIEGKKIAQANSISKIYNQNIQELSQIILNDISIRMLKRRKK